MPSNESPSDLEQRLASVVLAEVMRGKEPAPARFVRGSLDEGDTQPFAIEEATQPSAPYDKVDVEMEVDLGTAPAPKFPPAVELQLSAGKNLVLDTVQFAKLERVDLPNKPSAPTTQRMAARRERPQRAATEKALPVPRKQRASTEIMRTEPAKPSVLAMVLAFLFGATAFLTGLALARLMM